MRIIGGSLRSRRLKGTPSSDIRPTSDKLRETLFNVLGPGVGDAVFLDGYSGTGAIGIEAVSRGAHFVYFVDDSRKACAVIRENLASLGISEGVRVMQMSIAKAVDMLQREMIQFDVAFLDPPYGREDLYYQGLEQFATRRLLKEDGILILEHSKRVELPETSGALRRYRTLVQGDSALALYRKPRKPADL
jgi:16S rRNA (guanine966-N2)-methyltransferase